MDRRSLIFALLVVAAFAHMYPAAAQSQQPFPHLGGLLVGGSVDFINIPHIGSMNAAIFSNYPGYNVGGKTLEQQVAAVKALNPNMKITFLHNIMEVPPFAQSSGEALYPEFVADNNNNWYLRSAYPGGSILDTTEGADYLAVNITTDESCWLQTPTPRRVQLIRSGKRNSPKASVLPSRQIWTASLRTTFSTNRGWTATTFRTAPRNPPVR